MVNEDHSPAPTPYGGDRLWKLESIRGMAALYVVLVHFGLAFIRKPKWYLPLHGQEAVMIFFLLSGFVIYYSTFGRAPDVTFRSYFIRRFRRIYPLFLVALAVGYFSASYCAKHLLPLQPTVLLGNLCMLQDLAGFKPGIWFGTYHDPPVWSLSYEWWFYMMFFPIQKFIRHWTWHKYIVAILSLAGFCFYVLRPEQPFLYLMYFIIWWSGVELAREYAADGVITWRRQLPMIALMSGMAVLWFIPVIPMLVARGPLNRMILGVHPFLEFHHLCTALIALVLGLWWYKCGFPGFATLLGWCRYLAPISYAIYIFHEPITNLMIAVGTAEHPFLTMAASLALIGAFSYLMEVCVQGYINRWSARFLAPAPKAQPVVTGALRPSK